MSANDAAGLYFLQAGTTINDAKYLRLLKGKLNIHAVVNDCNVFMHDSAPRHRSKQAKKLLVREK